MKRILSFFLSFFVLLSMFPIEVKADVSNVNVIASNGIKETIDRVNMDMLNGGELVLFTRDNSDSKVPNNGYRINVIVDYVNGQYIVKDINKINSEVPFNGFILQGHEKKATWLIENIKIGDKIQIENYKLPEPIFEKSYIKENGEKYPLKTINVNRESNSTGVFTRDYSSVSTPKFDNNTVEVVISNGTVVAKNDIGIKGTYIPSNGYVLSFSGTEKNNGEKLAIGEKINLIGVEVKVLPEKYVQVGSLVLEITAMNSERGTGAVVLYDSSFGKTTGTNPWGMEFIVIDNKITSITMKDSVNNNNSTIPSNGYVVSIHSDNALFNEATKVKIGDNVKIVTDNLTLYKAGKTKYDAFSPKVKEDNPAGWDDTADKPFGGFRGANQLIVYDKSYGKETTETNMYGYEVVVNENGIVTKVGGNNSQIPEKGLVLSGHDIKANWLKNNVTVGSKITVDKDTKEVLAVFTPNSILNYLNASLEDTLMVYERSKKEFRDVPYTEIDNHIAKGKAIIAEAKTKIDNLEFDTLAPVVKGFEKELDEVFYLNTESRKVEFRSIWIRPKESTIEAVQAKLDALKDYNINIIYLESWFNGYTIYPTENKITTQNPMYKNFDVLKAYIEEGKKRGMVVHAWVENFFIGVVPSNATEEYKNFVSPVYQYAKTQKNWNMISNHGQDYQMVPGDIKYYFINPALKETRDFVMSIYHEIIDKYDVAGLQLDYVRYPDLERDANGVLHDFGYDEYTRSEFKKVYGKDPIDIKKDGELWSEWCKFREDYINSFVYRVSDELRAKMKDKNPNFQISADVWPNYEAGPITLKQHPKDWVSKGYINNLVPMSYMEFGVGADTVNTVSFTKGKSFATMGVSTYSNFTQKSLVRQLSEASRLLADGTALFEYETFLSGNYGPYIAKSVYRNKAIIPDTDIKASTTLLLEEVIRKTKDIYAVNNGIKDKDADRLIKDINKILDNISKDKLDKALYYLVELEKSLENNTGINKQVVTRINENLNFANRILVNAGVKAKG